MKRLAATFLMILGALSVHADELTPEQKVFTARTAVENLAIASDGKSYAIAVQWGGRVSLVRVSAEGQQLATHELSAVASLTHPQILFDGTNFVIVADDPERGPFAFWLSPDDSLHGPVPIPNGEVALQRIGDDAVAFVYTPLALFGENVKAYRLTRDYDVAYVGVIPPPFTPLSASAAFGHGRELVGWTEAWVRSPDCGIPPCGSLEALRFSMKDTATGSTYVSPQWSLVPRHELRLIAIPDGFGWFALRYGQGTSIGQIEAGIIKPDQAPDEPHGGGTILSDAFRDSYDVAFTGSRFLLARKVSIPDEHSVTGRSIGVEARWITLHAEGRFAASTPFVVDRFVNAYAVSSTGEGRAAVVYSKVQYTNNAVIPLPDVFIRIAGEHEPSRTRAVRR